MFVCGLINNLLLLTVIDRIEPKHLYQFICLELLIWFFLIYFRIPRDSKLIYHYSNVKDRLKHRQASSNQCFALFVVCVFVKVFMDTIFTFRLRQHFFSFNSLFFSFIFKTIFISFFLTDNARLSMKTLQLQELI
jgi:hypothetical protein